MPRKPKPPGRRDHQQQVARARAAAKDAGLTELLDGIAADPDAGEWGEWAAEMLRGDREPDKKRGREK